ncbi:Clp protease N-terminal domain-containing protein [Streptomyces sp. NPDC058279]|uniref:Clp protease N-terminal domain-containing protein n=1 Tax=Streptomyces sp. NPDC058279 TaxID=3346418 RepID=UPI0036ED9D14
MFEKFTAGARTAVTHALEEARLRGDRRVGTEHLLLGVLHEPGSPAVRCLGVGLDDARSALADLDRSALAAIGIDVRGVDRPPVPASRKRTPFTSGARSVLPRALGEVKRTGGRRLGEEHLLLALLAGERTDPVAELLDRLGVDRSAARERLRGMDAA